MDMSKYVKVKFHGKVTPYLLWVDSDTRWSDSKIESAHRMTTEIAKSAFLDHGQFKNPYDVNETNFEEKAPYLNPKKGEVLLIYQGGQFMPLTEQMEIIEEVYSEYFPIDENAALALENDPIDNGLDHIFLKLAKEGGVNSFSYMFNFKNREKSEIINAFKKTPAIIFSSSYVSSDWWELFIECYIKSKTKARVVAHKPWDIKTSQRMRLCTNFAKKYGIEIIEA